MLAYATIALMFYLRLLNRMYNRKEDGQNNQKI